jgi:hypothetical protein
LLTADGLDPKQLDTLEQLDSKDILRSVSKDKQKSAKSSPRADPRDNLYQTPIDGPQMSKSTESKGIAAGLSKESKLLTPDEHFDRHIKEAEDHEHQGGERVKRI